MDSVKIHMASTLAGFILDACFGDPHFLPHPVRGIGNLISLSEKGIRRLFPKTEKGELAGGALFVLLVLGITAALSFVYGMRLRRPGTRRCFWRNQLGFIFFWRPVP